MLKNKSHGLWRNRGLLWRMTWRDMKGKYVGSLMGVFWTVINPLLLLLIFTFIFTVIFRARFGSGSGFGHNALYILAGILPWLAFQEGVGRSSTVLLENANLLTRAMFPAEVLPAYPVFSALLGQMIGMAILLIIAGAAAARPGISLVMLPLLLLLQAVFTLGLCFIVSGLNVYLRDVVHLIPVLLLVWMYGTPIFYPASMVPDKFRVLIEVNPLAHFVEAYRRVILEGAWPAGRSMIIIALAAIFMYLIGQALYRRWSPGFADRL